MKKGKLFVGLSAAFVAFMSLVSCSGIVRAKDYVVLTINGEPVYASELFEDQKSEAAAKEMFDAVYRVAVRKYFADGDGKQYMDEITKDTKIKMSGQKDIAQSNADKNGTSYAEEWQKILDSNGVEDEDELYDKFEYEIEKDKFNEKFYEGEGTTPETKYKNLQVLRDGGKFSDDEGDEEKIGGYLVEKKPYHVRHILVKVSAAKDDPCTGEITESEAKKLSDVITNLAEGKDFAWVANMYSDDTGSKDKDGDLGIMDLDTSFVSEFKLGTYVYESFFGSSTKEKAVEGFGFNPQTVKDGTAAWYAQHVRDDIKDPTNLPDTGTTKYSDSIGQIPYEAALALKYDSYDVTYKDPSSGDSTTVTKNAFGNYSFDKLKRRLGGRLPDGVTDKPKYYPRNVIFNKYFNKNNIMVITPTTFHSTPESDGEDGEWFTEVIEKGQTGEPKSWRRSIDKYNNITPNADFGAKVGFTRPTKKNDDDVETSFDGESKSVNPSVLRDENGRVIFVFRSGTSSESSNEDTGYQGIHFVCIERSPFIEEETYKAKDKTDPVKVTKKEYFTEYYPEQTGGFHPTYNDDSGNPHDKITYPNYFPAKHSIDKKARSDDLNSKIKAYNPNINTYIYRYLLTSGNIEFTEDAAKKLKIDDTIRDWINLQREDAKYQTDDKWNTTWKDYYFHLLQTTKTREPVKIGDIVRSGSPIAQYEYGIVAEAAAFAYSSDKFGYDEIATYFGTGGVFNE